jgi:hypothetical protein
MTAVLIALLGIIGTLGGVTLTTHTQRETTARAERAADRRRLIDHRATAFSAFAEDLMEYTRVELDRWHQVNTARRAGQELKHGSAPSAAEARIARTATWGSFYRMRLLWDDRTLVAGAEALLHAATALEYVDGADDVKAAAERIRAELGELADSARRTLIA